MGWDGMVKQAYCTFSGFNLWSLSYSVLEISKGIIQNKNMAMHHVWLEILDLQT